MTQTISQSEAVRMIQNSGGQLFRVHFIKRSTGSRRGMTARVKGPSGKWKTGVSGEGMNHNPSDHDLVPVREFVTNPETPRDAMGRFVGRGNMGTQFRSIPAEGIYKLRIRGTTYAVVSDRHAPAPF